MKFPRRFLPLLLLAFLLLAALTLWRTGAWIALRNLVDPPNVEVHFIDVGHANPDEPGLVGESILLRSDEGKVALIDGGYPNTGALQYLAAQGITHIDLLVLTHPHDDHSGGLIEVLNTLPVDLLVTNGEDLPDESPIYDQFVAAAQATGVKTHIARSGDKIPFGSLTFNVLSPRKIHSPKPVNAHSIVMRLTVGHVTFLFTGDTLHREEERLLAVNADLRADILKVAHHGADTSSLPAFLEKVDPQVAIYSVGTGNMYDFPHQVTIDSLHAAGADIYGTDRNGTIIVTSDGFSYSIDPERSGPRDSD